MQQSRPHPEGDHVPAWDRASVPAAAYEEIARALSSEQSPVGIDAKHTHILILHVLDRLERRLDGHAGVAASEADDIRGRTDRMLERVPSAASLSGSAREKFTTSLTAAIVAAAGGPARAQEFPAFVADLIQGVFQAIVNSSIEQMEAYADLVQGVGSALDDYQKDGSAAGSAPSRQKLLATMALMGVEHASISRKGVRLRSVLAADEEDEKRDGADD